MMRVKHVIDRLSDELVPETFVLVSGLGDMPADPDAIKWNRKAFVMPQADIVGPNNAGTGLVSQLAMRVVKVAMGFTRQTVRSTGDLDSIEDVVELVKKKMIGWVPPGENSPVIYITGGVAEQYLDRGLLIWGCTFGCPYFLEA